MIQHWFFFKKSWIDNRTVPIIISWLLSHDRIQERKRTRKWSTRSLSFITFSLSFIWCGQCDVKRWTNSRSLRTSRSLLFSQLTVESIIRMPVNCKWKKNYVNVIDCWSLVFRKEKEVNDRPVFLFSFIRSITSFFLFFEN